MSATIWVADSSSRSLRLSPAPCSALLLRCLIGNIERNALNASFFSQALSRDPNCWMSLSLCMTVRGRRLSSSTTEEWYEAGDTTSTRLGTCLRSQPRLE